MGHILSVGFSWKLSSVCILLLCKMYLSLLDMIWYHQKFEIPMTRFVKIINFVFVMEFQTFWSEQSVVLRLFREADGVFYYYPGSHEYLDYHAVHCCAKTSQFFCNKWNIASFVRRGSFYHPIWDRFCHLVCWWFLITSLINNYYRWLWSRLAIRVHPDHYCSESPIKYVLVHR